MRWLEALITVLLALVLTTRASWCSLQWSSVGEQKNKRWSCIPTTEDAMPGEARPWPPTAEREAGELTSCFGNEESLSKLGPIFRQVIAKWQPAIEASSLEIIPDPACLKAKKHDECFCDVEGVLPWSLRIELTRSRSSTVGFQDFLTTDNPRGSIRGRNFLEFAPFDGQALNVLLMAHELGESKQILRSGHAIGLYHEHQRPDAGRFVQFDCRALAGYAQAKTLVLSPNDPLLPPQMPIERKMELVCSTPELAKKYLDEAFDWMPGVITPDCGGKHTSKAYDFSSIMGYPSSLGFGGVPQYPLLRHKRHLSHGEFTDIENRIYLGGHKDPRLIKWFLGLQVRKRE